MSYIKLNDLQSVRVTAMAVMERCPKSWAEQTLLQRPYQKKRESTSAKIGTAAHTLIEFSIRSMFNMDVKYTDEELERCIGIIPEDEYRQLHKYIIKLREQFHGYMLLSVEDEFNINIDGFGPMIVGHMDAILYDPITKHIIVLDHKTNRERESADEWFNRLQQCLYMYIVRRWIDTDAYEVNKWSFCIGYVNVHTDDMDPWVQWEHPEEEDEKTVARMRSMWNDALIYEQQGIWPATANDKCGWCIIGDLCAERTNAVQRFNQSYQLAMSHYTAADRLAIASPIVKQANDLIDELRDQVKRDMLERGETERWIGDTRFSLSKTRRRSFDHRSFRDSLIDNANIDSNKISQILSDIEQYLEPGVKVIDALREKYPELTTIIDEFVTITEIDVMTVKSGGVRKIK